VSEMKRDGYGKERIAEGDMLGISESCAKFHRNRHTFVVC